MGQHPGTGSPSPAQKAVRITLEAQKETKVLDRQRLRTFVLGGAVGALVGILLAPRSGRELRGSLANRAGEARERGRETYFGAQEQMRDRLAEAREGSRVRRPEVVDLGGSSPSAEETEPYRPYLRDVSRDVAGVEADDETAVETTDEISDETTDVERSEELRRKVRETRERLRGHEGGEPDREQ
jgi:gas vesicle protein